METASSRYTRLLKYSDNIVLALGKTKHIASIKWVSIIPFFYITDSWDIQKGNIQPLDECSIISDLKVINKIKLFFVGYQSHLFSEPVEHWRYSLFSGFLNFQEACKSQFVTLDYNSLTCKEVCGDYTSLGMLECDNIDEKICKNCQIVENAICFHDHFIYKDYCSL